MEFLPLPQSRASSSLFWSTHAHHIIQAYATHFLALDGQQTAAIALQSWQGGHLNTAAQELVTPPDILSMMSVWLSEAVAGFSSQSQAARLPSSVVVESVVWLSSSRLSPTILSFRPNRLCCLPFPSSAPFSFCISAASFCRAPRRPPCCLWPFCPTSNGPCFFHHTRAPPFHHFACWGPLLDTSVGVRSPGPARQHCDRHDNDGRFSHIGDGVLRLEGQTAWGCG